MRIVSFCTVLFSRSPTSPSTETRPLRKSPTPPLNRPAMNPPAVDGSGYKDSFDQAQLQADGGADRQRAKQNDIEPVHTRSRGRGPLVKSGTSVRPTSPRELPSNGSAGSEFNTGVATGIQGDGLRPSAGGWKSRSPGGGATPGLSLDVPWSGRRTARAPPRRPRCRPWAAGP